MNTFFTFFSANAAGIFVLLAILASIVLLIQWLTWVWGVGRFKREADGATRTSGTRGLRFIFADLLVAIINDFRHMLALIIVMIFAVSLGVAMYIGQGSIANFKEALQIVVATLGGLVGSIIGYYFGESAVAKQQANTSGGDGTSTGGGKVEPTSGEITRPSKPPELQQKLASKGAAPPPSPPAPEGEG